MTKSIWTVLQIEATHDTKAIRQAYAKQLLKKNPEVDPEGFQHLRAAYETALSQASSHKSSAGQGTRLNTSVTEKNEQHLPSHIISGIPKTPEILPTNPEHPLSQLINGIPKTPEVIPFESGSIPSETTPLQVRKMMERLSVCKNELSMLELLKQWSNEGLFNHFGISLGFQEELLESFSFRSKYLKKLFLAAYQLFSWKLILQKPSDPLAKKLTHIIEKNRLEDILSLLEKTKGLPLLYAAVINDVESGQQLLQKNPQILKERDAEGNSALHIACEVHALEFASFLISQNIPLEVQNNKSKTALTIAIQQDHLELVQILCKAGANVNHADGQKHTPLYTAVLHSNKELVSYLVSQAHIELDPEALCAAVSTDQLEFVQLLIERGWEVSPENVREPPLIAAARLNHLDILNYLLEQGTDPHQTNEQGTTALTVAAERGFTQVVELLLQRGADDNSIINAANAAMKYNHFDIVQLVADSFEMTSPRKIINFRCIKSSMHSHGFTSNMDDYLLNIEAIDYTKPLAVDSLPPLIQAVYQEDLPRLKQLLQEGSDPHKTLQNGLAALHIAIQLHRHGSFDCLIQHGVDINQVAQPHYYSPLFIAVKVQNRHAYKKLIELGAKDLPTGSRHNALFAAVYNNDLSVVQELISRGSDLYQYAGEGFRTLIYATVRHQHHEMVKVLLSYGLDPDRVAGDPFTPLCINYHAVPDAAVTPLALAVKIHDIKMLEILLQAGADPNRKSIGVPPLHFTLSNTFFPASETINYYSIIEKAHSIIDLLLQNGADIHLKSDEGRTFLSTAVWSGPVETVMYLVELGANVHIPDDDGKLPIDRAREAKRSLIVRYLEQQMMLHLRLTPDQMLSRFLLTYLDPTLRAHGYQRQGKTWWKDKEKFFLVIQLQNFPWCKESVDFCFNIGVALTSKTSPTFSDCIAHAPETAYLSTNRKKHPYKRKIGYSLSDSAVLSHFIQELALDFEKEILPLLESFQTLEDSIKFFQDFPTFGKHLTGPIYSQLI